MRLIGRKLIEPWRVPRLPGRYEFNSISEMCGYYYGAYGGVPFEIQKDAPVLTTTTGVYQALYGKKIWSWLNQEANAFAILPKKPWDQSGWRVMTTRAASSGGGVGEHAALPATIMPTFALLTTKPKVIAHTFNQSEMANKLTKTGDDTWPDMAELRKYMGLHHAEMINIMLMTQNGSVASNSLESIDRVVSTTSEIANGQENDQSTGYTANDGDIYSQDRDSTSTCDSNVLHNSTSGTRTLSLDLIDELIEDVETAAPDDAGQRVFLTGYDTIRKWSQLLQGQQRFMEVQEIQLGVNGVKTVPGAKTGFRVASYNGIPIVPTKNCVKETNTNGMSRIYLLDMNHLYIRVLAPTQYFEVGISTGNPFGINKIGDEGLYRTTAELICTNFKAHGKIRDLKTA